LHKILEVLLKDYQGPRKSCLGAACSSQNIKQRLTATGLKHGTSSGDSRI